MKKLIILIFACVSGGIFAQESPNVKNDKINNSFTDFGTAFLRENEAVSNVTPKGLTYNQNKYSSKTFSEPIMGEINNENLFLLKKNLLGNSNSSFGNGMVTYSKDGKTVFFSVNRKIKKGKIKNAVNLQLFRASINKNGEWVNIEMLPFNSNQYSTGQPVLNEDDSKLYFVSDGPESLGRTDIFVVDLHNDGTYGEPINMGPKINSREREIFPFIDKENLLYFSSDAHNKRGDLDVFACKIFDNTISRPVKLKGIVNFEKEDFIYDIDNEKLSEKISSNNQVGKGVNDIYAFVDFSPKNFKCLQEISGIVMNSDTQELLPNVQIILFDKNDNQLNSFLSNETDASFSFNQTCNSSFKLKGYLDGYLIGELDLKTVNDLNADTIQIVLNMSADPNSKIGLMVDSSEANRTDSSSPVNEGSKGSYYDFNSENQVYTVQVGAFRQNGQTNKYLNLTSLFNHLYDDGFNRYYSGIFESYEEAVNYVKLIKKEGYNDAFVVGLKGERRF